MRRTDKGQTKVNQRGMLRRVGPEILPLARAGIEELPGDRFEIGEQRQPEGLWFGLVGLRINRPLFDTQD